MALDTSYDEVQLLKMPEGRVLIRLRPPQHLQFHQICLRPDGQRLWLLGRGHRIYEWNLAVLRQELARLGLDWED